MSARHDERGFTVVEVSVASLLLMLCLIVGLRFFDSAVSGAVDLERSTQQHADARWGTDRLVRELRQAFTGDPATPPVAVATARAITFYAPGTGTPFVLRRIAYRVQGGVLERSITSSTAAGGPPWAFGTVGPWAPVMEVRDADAFVARDAAGAVTTDPAAIESIDIALQVPNTHGRADRLFRSSITLRNAR